MMNPGRLKDRLTIQPRTTTPAVFGVTEEWTPAEDCAKRWARVIPLTTMQRLQWMQANVNATHRVIFRQDATLEGYDMGDVRFLWGSKVLTLISSAMRIGGQEDFLAFTVSDSDEGMADQRPPEITS